jgi:hypothetical protein
MADAGIKKVTIPKSSLPSVSDSNQHLVRFRVVSDDRNRYSQWSPIYLVSGTSIEEIDADSFTSGRIVTIAWSDAQSRGSYDIFVKFDDAEYSYHGTADSTQYSFIIPTSNPAIQSFQYVIQVVGVSQTYSPSLVLYESETKQV